MQPCQLERRAMLEQVPRPLPAAIFSPSRGALATAYTVPSASTISPSPLPATLARLLPARCDPLIELPSESSVRAPPSSQLSHLADLLFP